VVEQARKMESARRRMMRVRRRKKGSRDGSCLRTRVRLHFLKRHSQSGGIVLKEKPPAAKTTTVADMVHVLVLVVVVIVADVLRFAARRTARRGVDGHLAGG